MIWSILISKASALDKIMACSKHCKLGQIVDDVIKSIVCRTIITWCD